MKKTFKELLEIDAVVGGLYKKTPELKESKFGYAYNRFYAMNTELIYKKLQDNMNDIAVKHALEDSDTKELLKTEKGEYKYSRDGQLALMKDQRKIIDEANAEEVEVTPYISAFTPEMSDEDKTTLEGVLIEKK